MTSEQRSDLWCLTWAIFATILFVGFILAILKPVDCMPIVNSRLGYEIEDYKQEIEKYRFDLENHYHYQEGLERKVIFIKMNEIWE